MSAARWRPAVSRCDELDPTKYSATQTVSRPSPARQQIQKKRVPKFAYYSYSVNFSPYYSAEYE